MSHATVIAESMVRRLEAQHGPLGVDVRLHLANVLEMVERLPGKVENPAGLLVTWCQREADARQAQRAKQGHDTLRYALLQVEVYRELTRGRFTPRTLARVLTQASREGYPGLNPRTIDMLRAMGDRWDADIPARFTTTEGPTRPTARDAVGTVHEAGTGRSCGASSARQA